MQIETRLYAFSSLGELIHKAFSDSETIQEGSKDSLLIQNFLRKINIAEADNQWFTQDSMRFALLSLSALLQKEKLEHFVKPYNVLDSGENVKNIGVIMAGNVPAVGFHDFLCVLLSGNNFIGKLSSQDKHILPAIADLLIDIEPQFKSKIRFEEEKLTGFDAVIATGSNNSARYFDYYFGKYPHIIRKNRNSVAVLHGNETADQLKLLGKDCFTYFGLGCRNVSKLFVPAGYSFNRLFESFLQFSHLMNHNKYMNNYDYNRAVYLMNSIPFLTNEFIILKEDSGLSSPISVIFYEYYNRLDDVEDYLLINKENIQCVVDEGGEIGGVAFGNAQSPELFDFADGIDTMNFLIGLNKK